MAKELTRKEKQITELYFETTLNVGKNADNWISFLKRASFNYKYRFDEQILIYAQRPDAVACAETTIWNKKLKRWINKGSKGIALITEKEGELGLRFVFDVSDTNSDVYGRKFKLWQAEEKYTNDIIEALEDKFGTMEDKSSLPLAENPMNDYLKDREVPETEEKVESAFNKWLDTFIEEKGIDLEQVIEIKTEDNTHYFEIGNIIANIKATTPEEQAGIKDMIVKIDFYNGDVVDYFRHLAQVLAENFEKQQEQPKEEKQEEQIEDTKEQEIIAEKLIKKNRNIEYFDLHPEIPTEERNNFRITDDNLGVGTAKEKYRNNVEAIKVLKLCEEQNRYATPEEQIILSKYVGWGGLKSAFEDKNDSWASEYAELKELLTEDEYKDARASSVTAYYTPPVVIRNIYKALQNMGLKQANILEPSCRCR